MEKITDDDNHDFSESNGVFNKLPLWLVEMTENVKKLKTSEEDMNFISSQHFNSDHLSSTILSTTSDVTEAYNRIEAIPRGIPFAVEAPDVVGGCIILQSSTTASLPNTPKEGYEFSRTVSALSAFSLPDTNENDFLSLDKYLDDKDIEKYADLDKGTKDWEQFLHSESKLPESSQQQRSYTKLQKKSVEKLTTNLSTVDIQAKKNRRISRHHQVPTTKSSRIRIPPYKGTNNHLQSRDESIRLNLPIGVIKRRQDYLAGVASKVDIGGTDPNLVWTKDKQDICSTQLRVEAPGLNQAIGGAQKNVSDHPITEKVFQLNLQARKKPNLTEIVKKNVQADLIQGENSPKPLLSRSKQPLYHYERYPSKDNNIPQDFIIPELPRGGVLTIDILTTWGDKHYVGLNGIEIYSDDGEPVTISKIWADPTDINVLPEYTKDPRVVGNLINGINQTTDDYNLWLTPYTSGEHHYIHMTFQTIVNIAMIRIWNYNKSRIHSYRGVRDVKITLDDVVIFDGEIARASGGVFGNINSFGDTILFTTDEGILEQISQHDATYCFATENTESPGKDIDRPITTDTGEGRPLTCASSNQSNLSNYSASSFSYVCKEIELVLLSNWGHSSLIGLSGVELIGDHGAAIPLTQASLCCNLGNENVHRLVNGNNLSIETSHMWAVYYLSGDTVIITITFTTEIFLTGIRIWNYNASLDLSYCGAKQIIIKLDGKSVCDRNNGFTLRRAPGCCHYDYVQEINFANQSAITEPCRQRATLFDTLSKAYICVNTDEYEAPMTPQGFVYQVIIFSTWGDPYYVGLTGIQMFDSKGYLIQLTKDNIAAYPESVNIIEGVDNDVRTPEKLVDGVNDTTDGHHMWLAPILPNQTNRVYIIFDSPVTVSMIKLWNYKKTLKRGVKEFGILVDDLLVYNGVLNTNIPYGTVLFTGHKDGASESHSLAQSVLIGQDMKLMNLERRATSGGDCYADPSLRPHTSLMQTSLRSNTTSNM